MGKFDMLDKVFFAEPERFAELINTEMYYGEKVLLPERLTLLKRSYPSFPSLVGEKSRDILMYDTRQNICYGLEIETNSDYSMPERIMVYDASEYEYQLQKIHGEHRKRKDYREYREKKSRMKETDSLIPTITLVLYVGEGCWCGRMKLQEMFRLSEQVKRQLGKRLLDYDFPLMEADAICAENYHTDLREFFQALQCRGNLAGLEELFQKERFQSLSRETQCVIAAHLGNNRLYKEVEEGVPVCKALDDLCKRERTIGREEGEQIGRKKGIEEGIGEGIIRERFQIIQKMLQAGMEETLIISILNCTKEELELAATGR